MISLKTLNLSKPGDVASLIITPDSRSKKKLLDELLGKKRDRRCVFKNGTTYINLSSLCVTCIYDGSLLTDDGSFEIISVREYHKVEHPIAVVREFICEQGALE